MNDDKKDMKNNGCLAAAVIFHSFIHSRLYQSGFRQNTAYRGIDFILFSYPKFRVERRMEYFGE